MIFLLLQVHFRQAWRNIFKKTGDILQMLKKEVVWLLYIEVKGMHS